MAHCVRSRLVGGVLVVALRVVGRMNKFLRPLNEAGRPFLDDWGYMSVGSMRVVCTAAEPHGVEWRVMDSDGGYLPGGYTSAVAAKDAAVEIEGILRVTHI